MKGLSVEPGERFAVAASTWPSMLASAKFAEPTWARTRIVRVSTSIAAALFTPWPLRAAMNERIARSSASCVGAWIASTVSGVSGVSATSREPGFSSACTACGAPNGNCFVLRSCSGSASAARFEGVASAACFAIQADPKRSRAELRAAGHADCSASVPRRFGF